MISRLSSFAASRTMLANLQLNYQRLEKLQGQMSSGRALGRPSDGPSSAITAVDLRNEMRRAEQLGRNANDAASWLGTADNTLVAVVDRLNRARDLALQGANGSTDAAGGEALAVEVEGIRDNLVALANTSYLGRPIFAGNADVLTAYTTAAPAVYQGAPAAAGPGGIVARAVAPNVVIQINVQGPDVFGVGPAHMFQELTDLAAAIRAGNGATIATGITNIDVSTRRIQDRLVEVGARSRQVEDIQRRNSDVLLEMKSSLSEVEDIDVAETLIGVKTQEMAYQGALAVTAKVIQPSLLDFLR